MLVGVFPISKITAGTAHCTDSSCTGCTAQVRRILMEHSFLRERIRIAVASKIFCNLKINRRGIQ